jgi:hypothetical protein
VRDTDILVVGLTAAADLGSPDTDETSPGARTLFVVPLGHGVAVTVADLPADIVELRISHRRGARNP